jgi:ubiquitin-protein ligase
MDNVRLRRLKADYEALRRLAHLHPRIEIEGVFGNPPERYRLRLKVKSLRERGEVIETVTEHRLEVMMPQGYPRDAPMFRMLTPVFHPNIAPHAVCIGDNWTAGESIDHLIQRVGEILAYQSYNTKSPLNGRAAQWVDEHRDRLPVDHEEFFLDLSAAPAPDERAAPACANCGAKTALLASCRAGHALCGDCAMQCPTCATIVCLSCGDRTCPVCAAATPACANCGAKTALLAPCRAGHASCGDCAMQCPRCATLVCLVCGDRACPVCVAVAAPA